MRLKALQVLEDGPEGRVQVTLADADGNQATYQYSGILSSRVLSNNAGYLDVSLRINKPDVVSPNSSSSRFTP
jgi:hypothetical protein